MISNIVENFNEAWQADLWRGIGIAVAYVGGCDDAALKKIWEFAGMHHKQLACGAALVAKSRQDAKTSTNDTDRCSRLWFMHAEEPSTMQSSHYEDFKLSDINNGYLNWVKQIEQEVANSFSVSN